MPPTLKELSESLAMKLEPLEQLLRLCIEDGLLVKVADGLFFSPEALEQARAVCAAFLDQHGPATVSQLREAWGVTRKFAFPLCEFFDEQGITTRTGDQRTAGPKIAQSFRA
jgi:selenocysteine-specific elongation factor